MVMSYIDGAEKGNLKPSLISAMTVYETFRQWQHLLDIDHSPLELLLCWAHDPSLWTIIKRHLCIPIMLKTIEEFLIDDCCKGNLIVVVVYFHRSISLFQCEHLFTRKHFWDYGETTHLNLDLRVTSACNVIEIHPSKLISFLLCAQGNGDETVV